MLSYHRDMQKAARLNEAGEVIYNLQDPNGKYDYVTSVLQIDKQLYLGSLKEPTFGIYTLE